LKIKIVRIGKNKDTYIHDGESEFLKRLSPFCKIEIVDLKESRISKTFSKEQCVKEEEVRILSAVSDDYLVLLDESGSEMTSIEFSKFLSSNKDVGKSICFVIGGAFGVGYELKSRADKIISFSKMTLTHQMIRLFLVEQIYRGICIMNDKEYHHE